MHEWQLLQNYIHYSGEFLIIMHLLEWLLQEHPFFSSARNRVIDVISQGNIDSLDSLTIRTRMPVRTVLLVLFNLVNEKQVNINEQGISVNGQAPSQTSFSPLVYRKWSKECIAPSLREKYLNLASKRKEPALLWGQRRLVPESAIERSLYIISQLKANFGKVAFLGDDDLTSPIFAALVPGWETHVADIDKGVLEEAELVSKELDSKVYTHQVDLSQNSFSSPGSFDIAVCDPFPSGDGNFEAMFWHSTTQLLRPGGILITTVAPSHKPISYSSGALSQLNRLGFYLLDLQADYGRYEVFDFEFIPFEKNVISRLGLHSSISQTKSILTAVYRPSNEEYETVDFNFVRWSKAATMHYLTVQAGISKQLEISQSRGLKGLADETQKEALQGGLKVKSILPSDLRKADVFTPHLDSSHIVSVCLDLLSEHYGVEATDKESEELYRLAKSSTLSSENELAQLGLAIRAIESWERWQFDE